jgi:hypothetical protein
MRYSILRLTFEIITEGGKEHEIKNKSKRFDCIADSESMRKWCKQDEDYASSQPELYESDISYLLLIDEGLIEVVTKGSRIVHRATPRGLDQIKKFERLLGNGDKMIVKPEICLQSSC